MNDLTNSFNEYMASFTGLTISEKREEIIVKIKELVVIMQQIANIQGVNNDVLINREMIDLKGEDVSEDDYLEGLFAYVCALEDLIGKNFENI